MDEEREEKHDENNVSEEHTAESANESPDKQPSTPLKEEQKVGNEQT